MKTLLIVASLVLSTSTALACSCAMMTAESIIKNSDIVFLGGAESDSKLTGVVNPEFPSQKENKTTFYITKAYKNLSSASIDLYGSKPDGSNCGIEFKNDNGVYIVSAYLDPSSKKYFTSVCDVGHLGDESMLQMLLDLEKISRK